MNRKGSFQALGNRRWPSHLYESLNENNENSKFIVVGLRNCGMNCSGEQHRVCVYLISQWVSVRRAWRYANLLIEQRPRVRNGDAHTHMTSGTRSGSSLRKRNVIGQCHHDEIKENWIFTLYSTRTYFVALSRCWIVFVLLSCRTKQVSTCRLGCDTLIYNLQHVPLVNVHGGLLETLYGQWQRTLQDR